MMSAITTCTGDSPVLHQGQGGTGKDSGARMPRLPKFSARS